MSACLLAFDTSTETLSVAACMGARRVAVNESGGALSSARLLPRVRELLAELGLSLADLQAIGFGRGPGAFTGLRTSCAVAQGLGFGAAVPVVPLDSLLIVAEDARAQLASHDHEPMEITVAMDARMDEIYGGVYAWEGGAWLQRQAPALYTLPAWLQACELRPPQVLAGSALRALGTRWPLPAMRTVEQEQDRAAALLRLTELQYAAGAALDAAQALPLYVRDKVAFTTRERQAQRAAKEALVR